MKYLTIEALRRHINSYPEDDDLAEMYWELSLAQVENDINRSLESVVDDNGQLPLGLIRGALLLTGHLYRNREATGTASFNVLPLGYSSAIKKYRHFDSDWRSTTTEESSSASSDESSTTTS